MTLLIDALNQAEQERNKKLNISFADEDEYLDQSDQKQDNVTTINSNPLPSTKPKSNEPNLTLAQEKPNIDKTLISSTLINPIELPQSQKKKSHFKLPLLIITALIIAIAGSVQYYFPNYATGFFAYFYKTIDEQKNDNPTSVANSSKNLESKNNQPSNTSKLTDLVKMNQTATKSDNMELLNQTPSKTQNLDFSTPSPKNFKKSDLPSPPATLENKITQNSDNNQVDPKQTPNKVISYNDFEKIVIKRTKQPVSKNLTIAAQHLQNQNYAEAGEIYQSLLKIQPNNIEALQNLGVIAFNQGQNQEAKKWFTKVLEQNPNNRFANNVMNAIQGFNDNTSNVNTNDINSGQSSFIQGTLNAEKGQWLAARNQYARALASDPQNPDYAYNLAVAFDNLGDLNNAYRYYQRALQNSLIQPSNFSSSMVRDRIDQINLVVSNNRISNSPTQ